MKEGKNQEAFDTIDDKMSLTEYSSLINLNYSKTISLFDCGDDDWKEERHTC